MERVRRNDLFFVHARTMLSTADFQTLSLFYQPLVGVSAFSLYLTLFSLLNRSTLVSEKYLHADLESILDVKLETLEEARFRLEAVGLLTTAFKSDCFLYELALPMTPSSFVNDGVLGQYLRGAITEERYTRIVKLFKTAKVTRDGYVDVTKAFDEVFPALPAEDGASEEDLPGRVRSKSVRIRHSTFDFRLFAESMNPEFFDPAQLTDVVRDKIDNLAYVYGLDELAMKDVWVKAVDKTKPVDFAKLASYARDAYKLSARTSPEPIEAEAAPTHPVETGDPVVYFSAVSPKELLGTMSGGKVAIADLRIVERLLNEIGLDKGVVNVMLAYVLKNNHGDMPSYEYFEKIGLSWKRNRVDSVGVAVDYVTHLNAEYEKKQETGAARRAGRYGKDEKPDVKIDWLDEYMKSIQ
ncbi:MAG: DnaD domain protein [Candidatus Izemoplasmatales bacterium]